jgi:hypothetical protein
LARAVALARPIVTPESVRCVSVPVRRVATMLGIVLPAIALACLTATGLLAGPINIVSIAPCIDVVLVEVVLVIDVDVAVVPIAIAPVAAGPGTQRKSGRAPRQPHAGVVPRIGIRIIGVLRRAVNDRRVVRGHVNYLGISRLNDDHLFAAPNCFGLHSLLRACLQSSFAFSFPPHPLDGIHHIGRLRQKRVPEIGRPLNVAL